MSLSKPFKSFLFILTAVFFAILVALPSYRQYPVSVMGHEFKLPFGMKPLKLNFMGKEVSLPLELKMGLDVQGGMQVVLEVDMSQIASEDKDDALESAREVILKRVDAYGIAEPSVVTAKKDNSYRIIVELPGVDNPTEALNLVGKTADLSFVLLKTASDSAEASAAANLSLEPTGLTGKDLKKAQVSFDPNTGEPQVALTFNETGAKKFAQITKENTGQRLAVMLDGQIITAPVINSAIPNGQAVITGSFSLDEAKNLVIQLNAGALPVPIKVLEQRQLGASLGQQAVKDSVVAGLIGLGLVMLFMVLIYGSYGLVADIALLMYAVFTLAIYKLLGVTLTLPGIAGLILSIGMAVDANILIFERIKEELRAGKSYGVALELGFGRAWDSIKDANVATILTALVLINPFNFSFLSTSGMVRGFGITLLIGVILGLISGVVITRTLMRLVFKGRS